MRARADLLGPGWGDWRGGWQSRRRLLCRDETWSLHDGEREVGWWPNLRDAVRELWPAREVRDGRPWAVGWVGYEEAARLAGRLPFHSRRDALPGGWLLLEPEGVEPAPVGKAGRSTSPDTRWSLDDAAFRDGVAAIREEIAAGGVYQVNLSRRLSVDGWEGSLSPLVEAAARDQPPEYLAHFDDDGGELVCASMELLLRRRGRALETRPIKGTRPRGGSPDEDRRWAEELDADPKERAELAMIVDLERNDLGRIAEVGSVRVEDPGSVCSFATVHHRMGRVVATARPGLEWWEVVAAMAPGGSVTGCPKRAAMDVIAELEPVARGPFTGVLGVVAGNGDLELALPIRTAWKVGSRLEFAAGCGIVWQSDPEAEERESRLKVSRWLELVGCPA